MKPKTLLILALILAAAMVVVLGWRPTSAAIRKVVTNLTSATIKTANNNGLVGFWNFDDCDTCTTANDMSGNGRIGTMYTAASTAGNLHAAGKIGNGANFDGTNDDVGLGTNVFSNAQITNGTISFWFRADTLSPSNYNCLLNVEGVLYICPNSGIIKMLVTGVAGEFSVGSALSTATWYHVALTWDGTTARAYLNGVETASQSTGSPLPDNFSRAAFIGAGWNETFPFDGLIDEVRIYNRALSAAEVKGLFEETKRSFVNMPQTSLLTDGLVGMWSFNGPDMNWALSTAEARDSSGSGNHGNVTNFGQEAVQPGIVGQALSFDGTNDRVVLTNAITGDDDYSYSAWVKLKALPTNGGAMVIFNSGNAANGDQTLWLLNNLSGFYGWGLSSYSATGADTASEGSLTAQTDVWYFVVGVRNSSDDSARVYVNGSQVAIDSNLTSPTALYGSTGLSSNIGMRLGGTRFFNGLIDEVRVYNRALSAAEVTQLYNAGRRE